MYPLHREYSSFPYDFIIHHSSNNNYRVEISTTLPVHKKERSVAQHDYVLRQIKSPYLFGLKNEWIENNKILISDPHKTVLDFLSFPNDYTAQSMVWKDHLSKMGKTFSIDFTIGKKSFLGKKLAAPTLKAFTRFLQKTALFISRQKLVPLNVRVKFFLLIYYVLQLFGKHKRSFRILE